MRELIRQKAVLALQWLFAALTLYGLWSTFYLSGDLATEFSAQSLALISSLVIVLHAAALLYWRNLLCAAILTVGAWLCRIPRRIWLIVLVGFGALLRLLWAIVYPPVQTSDMATYFHLAAQLAEHGTYQVASTSAYWPPGLPLSLYPWIQLFGKVWWVPLAHNMVLLAVTLLSVTALGRRHFDEMTARLSGFLVAAWPNLVSQSGLASKELLVLALSSAAVYFYFRTDLVGGRRWWVKVAAGMMIGGATLTQPSTILLAFVFVIAEALHRLSVRSLATGLIAVTIGASLIIAPWAIRNRIVLGNFVLVSTNGGDVLYRSNHDAATGGYAVIPTPYAERGEVVQDQLLWRDGLEWIKNNPERFGLLAFRKQILFLGEDANGIYETLRRGLAIEGARYVIWKGIANAGWVVMLSLAFLAACQGQRFAVSPVLIAGAASWLCYVFVHSVFESGGRHHIGLTSLLAVVMAAGLVWRESKSVTTSGRNILGEAVRFGHS